MTEAEIRKAERDAESDAEWLALLLLLAFLSRDRARLARLSFDSDLNTFRIDGRTVSARSIRSYLDRIEQRFSRRLVLLTIELEFGRISFDEWKAGFDRAITSSHILKAAFVLGGIAAAARNAAVIAQIETQLAFADRFARQVLTGRAGSYGKIRARAKSYMQASHLLYSELQLQLAIESARFTEARNVLRPSEHCSSSFGVIGCPEVTALKWIPIAQMVPIGGRRCGRHCRCYLEFR